MEQLVRTEDEKGAISEGSLFKLKVRDTEIEVQIAEKLDKPILPKISSVFDLERSPVTKRNDTLSMDKIDNYHKSFKVVLANESQQYILLMLSDIARHIRTFDIETAKRHSDYTEEDRKSVV